MFQRGTTVSIVARALGIHQRTAEKWWRIFSQCDMSFIPKRPTTGRPRSLSDDELVRLSELMSKKPHEIGLGPGGWMDSTVAAILKVNFGLHCGPKTVEHLMARLGWTRIGPGWAWRKPLQ